jgi:hypothetical protein
MGFLNVIRLLDLHALMAGLVSGVCFLQLTGLLLLCLGHLRLRWWCMQLWIWDKWRYWFSSSTENLQITHDLFLTETILFVIQMVKYLLMDDMELQISSRIWRCGICSTQQGFDAVFEVFVVTNVLPTGNLFYQVVVVVCCGVLDAFLSFGEI